MSPGLDDRKRRIGLALAVSVSLHALLLWGADIQLPQSRPSLPPLIAKLEALPTAPPARPKRRPPRPKVAPEPPPPAETPQPPEPEIQPDIAQAASSPVAASAPLETETLASDTEKAAERPPLPKHARLTFAVNKGRDGMRVGEAIHTLEIEDGHYVLQAETRTIGLVRLFRRYDIIQYSSGSYRREGLLPESFFEERRDGSETTRNAVEFDHAALLADFSHGGKATLPDDTQDILSIMYQFPPLQDSEIASVSVSNGKKIESYEFEIATDEKIYTEMGELLAVRLRKLHAPDEEGLEIWLAREYRLFPVKLRFIEKNGEISGEAVITDIRVSEEEGERNDVVD
ncbi:MAG: DUF3108 domain-containing protein [Gammaproteobacteria bacterium]|nr:DUF3108 domain-containing protein [Gammaproteobacteria bacterium]MBU1969052.1 DUF3108 domain-containing protein [Gammaproteobacteria bacterium]